MSGWESITHHVQRARKVAAALPSLPEDPRLAAAEIAWRTWGADLVSLQPALLNIAALANAMKARLLVHELRAPVPTVIAETDLHALPSEAPKLLRSPVLLEVRDPEHEAICAGSGMEDWGHTASLAAYELDGAIYLIGLGYPDGARVARWVPRWGEDLPTESDDERVLQDSKTTILGSDREAHDDWAADAIRVLVVLGLLLDAAQTPLTTTDEGPQVAGRTKGGEARPARAWSVRRVYLTQEHRARRDGNRGADGARGADGLTAAEVEVRGHLKRQPHGPGGALRRWVYVDGYAARRWIAPRPVKVIVAGRRGGR